MKWSKVDHIVTFFFSFEITHKAALCESDNIGIESSSVRWMGRSNAAFLKRYDHFSLFNPIRIVSNYARYPANNLQLLTQRRQSIVIVEEAQLKT